MEIPFYQLFNVHQIRSFLRGLFSASLFLGHIAPKSKIKLCQRRTVGTTKITKHLEITFLDLATSPQAQPMVCLLTSEIRQNLPVGFCRYSRTSQPTRLQKPFTFTTKTSWCYPRLNTIVAIFFFLQNLYPHFWLGASVCAFNFIMICIRSL